MDHRAPRVGPRHDGVREGRSRGRRRGTQRADVDRDGAPRDDRQAGTGERRLDERPCPSLRGPAARQEERHDARPVRRGLAGQQPEERTIERQRDTRRRRSTRRRRRMPRDGRARPDPRAPAAAPAPVSARRHPRRTRRHRRRARTAPRTAGRRGGGAGIRWDVLTGDAPEGDEPAAVDEESTAAGGRSATLAPGEPAVTPDRRPRRGPTDRAPSPRPRA